MASSYSGCTTGTFLKAEKRQNSSTAASSRAPLARALLSSLCTLLKSRISCLFPLFAALLALKGHGFAQPRGSGCCRVVASSQSSPAQPLSTSAWEWDVQRMRCREPELLGTFPAAFHPYITAQEFLQLLEVPLPWQGRGLFPFIPLSSAQRQRAGCNSNLHTINFCRFYSPHWSGIKQHRVETPGAGNGGAGCCPGVCTATHFTPPCPSAGTASGWERGGSSTSTTRSASHIDPYHV